MNDELWREGCARPGVHHFGAVTKQREVWTMSRAVLSILACLAIAANLLVPQRLLFYKACCYGEDGRLLADSAMPCKKQNGTERISGPDCCAPRECQLRPAAPSDSVVSGHQTPRGLDHAAVLPSSPVPLQLASLLHLTPRLLTCAGPPGGAELLSLQSRLNL